MDGPDQVSVVIPAYNAARYLAETLDSVLAQRGFALEIIVADDASDDDTAGVAMGYEADGVVLVRRDARGGISAARNSAIARAHGPLLAFVDADDRWPAGRLEKLVALLRGTPRVDMAFGHVEHFFCPSLDEEARRRLVCPALPMPGYAAGAMLTTLSTFKAVGSFDERLGLAEFLDWLARAQEMGLQKSMLEDVVLERRIHGANHTLRHREDRFGYMRALKSSLDRRRAGQRP